MLLDHLKKFPVSANGGLMLTKYATLPRTVTRYILDRFKALSTRDLKTYQDTIASFGLPALSERFEFLRQLGNIFLIQPDILKSYITENYLGRIEPILLRPYLAQRSDWAQFERAFDFGTNSVDGTADPDTPSVDGGAGTSGFRTLGMGVGSVAQLKDRLNVSNRLSMMMRDLENVRLGGASGSGVSENSKFSLNGLGFQSMNSVTPAAVANRGAYGNGHGRASPSTS